MAEMTSRSIRVPDDVWAAALETAADQDVKLSEVVRTALEDFSGTGCDSCGECETCGSTKLAAEAPLEPNSEESATIFGYGKFSETSNPEVQAVIDRAKELLREGAVGVSVATDLDPADLPTNPDDVTEDDIANAHQRNRHVAIVDTPAFSGAFLDLAADGVSVSGPLVFEGEITGDIRAIGPVGTFTIVEGERIPIIFDIHEGDHTGMVVGYIERLERVIGADPGNVAPLAASASDYPAYLFAEPTPGPMTVTGPDARGFYRYSGTAMPADVCHKGMGGCSKYKFRGFSLDYFHSGARIPLDDGTFTRVGPLMFGDLHADGENFNYGEALKRANEDARTVFTMGKVFHHPKGLLYSGVLMPDADVMRVQATAPSVEIWPDHRGRPELKTALQVPRPALPVVASLPGGGIALVSDEQPMVELEGHSDDYHARMESLEERLTRMETAFAPIFAAHLADSL